MFKRGGSGAMQLPEGHGLQTRGSWPARTAALGPGNRHLEVEDDGGGLGILDNNAHLRWDFQIWFWRQNGSLNVWSLMTGQENK